MNNFLKVVILFTIIVSQARSEVDSAELKTNTLVDYLNLNYWEFKFEPNIKAVHLEFISTSSKHLSSSLGFDGKSKQNLSIIIPREGQHAQTLLMKSSVLSLPDVMPKSFDLRGFRWLEVPVKIGEDAYLLGFRVGQLTASPKLEDFEFKIILRVQN